MRFPQYQPLQIHVIAQAAMPGTYQPKLAHSTATSSPIQTAHQPQASPAAACPASHGPHNISNAYAPPTNKSSTSNVSAWTNISKTKMVFAYWIVVK
jgi:hypothetical protein